VPAPVGSTGAAAPAAARTPPTRCRSASSKWTTGVWDSCRTLKVTPCAADALSDTERTVVTVFSSLASSGARASSQARTDEQTALEPPGSAMTLPNVASAPFSAAAWRAASTARA